jgi:tetratricopeptide (TPR) repeat protein
VLKSREKQLGSEHVSTLSGKHSLAGIYESQGRYDDAERLHEQVLQIKEKQLGSEHVSTLNTKHGLAGVFKSQGRYNDAEQLFE